MYWGNLLLFGFNFIKTTVGEVGEYIQRVAYEIVNLIPFIFYMIWRLLGWIVNGIETIFRNLAGLGDKGDIVSDIIGNSKVDQIFKNMVGLATALIIFFTIVKIIQDHYKEKDGGNPYKIVIRTFKGLLMFFFINAAVVVGLYASGVMFRALDAATGTGSTSVAGLAFKSMASQANRKLVGPSSRGWLDAVDNEYWSMMDDESSDNGRYFIVGFNDNNNPSGKALQARYTEAFPITQYGIVSSDGKTVTPLTKWIKTADWNGDKWVDDLQDGYGWDKDSETFKNKLDAPINYVDVGGGSSYATVGYKNDLLNGIDLKVTPSIDLAWSPVDIDIYGYRLEGTRSQDIAPKVSVLGNSYEIPMAVQWQQFMPTQKTSKSLEDSAKQFGINFKGNVALQDSTASASYSLQIGNEFSKKFEIILTTLLYNIAYTNTMIQVVQLIPEFPVVVAIGPTSINLIQVASPLIEATIEQAVNFLFEPLIPKNNDGFSVAEVFSGTPISHNGGIWCVMNFKSSTIDTTIEQYRIDPNFKDLWGQLCSNMNQLKKNLEDLNTNAFAAAAEGTQKIKTFTLRTQEQRDWMAYMGTVNEYNTAVSGRLQKLGNLLSLYDAAKDAIPGDNTASAIRNARSAWIRSEINGGYNGDMDRLESEITTIFTEMVSLYESMINGKRPVSNYADVILTRPVYKPIIEFGLTEQNASHRTVEEIKEFFSNKVARINLLMDTTNTYSDVDAAYRVVDWGDAYGSLYGALSGDGNASTRDVADLKYTYTTRYNESTGRDEIVRPGNASLVNTVGDLRYLSLGIIKDENDNVRWDGNGGVRYFAEKGYGINYGRSTPMRLKGNSYWGTDGIYVDGELVYHYYEGTTYRPVKNAFDDLTLSGYGDYGTGTYWGSGSANEVRMSTAALNAQINTAATEQGQMIDEMTTVDKTNPLAQDFAKELITFRRLGASGEGNDAVAKKSWIESLPKIKSYGTPSHLKMLHAMSANEVDDYMASTSYSERTYLLRTDKGDMNDAQLDASNWGGYVGQFNWQDHRTVMSLYAVANMNFPVGYIAIIAALGVYLNFAFALIQRAVNMAVLYMLSPITIAFYPFDDGSKFNSVFVKPFYNEAISAFAVIVSLNIFIVLMQPLETAVKNVAGTAMSWLALVAFVSMLPQVRNTVYSILGGSKMSEKSLSDTFKGAVNTMRDYSGIGKAVQGVAAAHKWNQQHKAMSQVKRDEERGKLQEKLDRQGYLSPFEQMRLNHLNKSHEKQVKASEKAAEKQAQIDKVRNDFDAAMKAANGDGRKERAAKNAYERAKAGLSWSQRRRMEKQDRAAAKVAGEQVKRSDFANGKEGEKAYQAALAAKKSTLLNNDDFKKSVNGNVVTKAFKGVGQAAHAMAYHVNNSIVGEMLHDYFGPDGKLANDKNSIIGAGIRMASPARNAKIRAERSAQYMKEKQEKYEALKVIAKNTKEFGQAVEATSNAVSESAQTAGAAVARQKAEAAGDLDTTKKLTNMYMSKYLQQGKTEVEARTLAQAEINDKMRVHSFATTSTIDKIKDIVQSTEYSAAHGLNSLDDVNDEIHALTHGKSETELKNVFEQLGGDQVYTNLAQFSNGAVNLNATERAKFIQSLYQQTGGDAAYDAGIAKGLKEYGVTMDMNDQAVLRAISKKEEENRRLMDGGSGAISKEIAEKKKQREEDVVTTAAKLAKDLGEENNLPVISAITKILTSADTNTSFDDITKQISTKLNLDLGDVQHHFGNSYADFAQKVQFNLEIEKLENMKNAAAKWEDALKTWSDDIGDAVSSADKSKLIAEIKQNFNSDLNSTDPNSFGYKKRQIILKYEADGGLGNQQCQAEIEQLRIATQAQMTDAIAEFARKNTEKIRVHNDAKVVREAARNLYSNKAFEAIVDGYDKVEALISRFGRDTLLKDSMLQKLEDDGNLAGAGDLQMQLINCIREHKFEEARQLGFDKATVDFFIDCEAKGDPRGDLDKIYDAASYAASYLGGVSGEFGGDSWQGAARATGALFAIKFKSARNEKMESLKSSEGQKEANARNTIDLYRAKTGEIFNQARWKDLQGQIVDMDGNVISVGDAHGVATALQHTIDKLSTSAKSAENNQYVKHNLQVLQDWVNKNSGKAGMESLVQEANYVLECVGQATVAEQASERTDMASQTIGITEQKIADLLKKVNSSGPGGK